MLKEQKNKQHHRFKFELFFIDIRILISALQFGFNPSNIQFTIMICLFIEDKQNFLKLAILLNFGIRSIQQENQDANILQVPYCILYFISCGYFLIFYLKLIYQKIKPTPQNKEINSIQKKLTQDNPPTFHIKSQEIQSIKKMEESKSQIEPLSASDIKPLALNSNHICVNEDDLIVENMPWISNQSVLVYNFELNLIYQTFYLGKLQKNMGDKIDCDQMFLDSTIMIACKEITELQGQSAFSDSIFSDGSYLFNNLNEAARCKVKGQYTLRELAQTLFKDYEKWKFFNLTIFKLKNDLIDLEGIQLKLYLNTIENHKFILFILEQSPTPLKLQASEIHSTLINIYSTFILEAVSFINCIQTHLLLLTSHLTTQNVQNNNNQNNTNNTSNILNTQDEFTTESLILMRYVSYKYLLFLGCMKDYVFYLSNSLFFKMSNIKMEELLDTLLVIYEPILQLKQIRLTTSIDLQEGITSIFSDQERIKFIISILLNNLLSQSVKSNIRLDVKSFAMQGIIVSIKDTKTDFENQQKQKILELIKNLNQQLKNQKVHYELDLTNPLELQICIILCWQLSGSLKKGLEFTIDASGSSLFTFVIESSTHLKYQQSNESSGPIKVLGRKKYFETSISLLLQEKNINSESKYFSLSQLSKQFSIKQSELVDLHSLSQISKIREASNSRGVPNSATIHKSREQSGSLSGTYKQQLNTDSIQQITKILNRNNISPNETSKTFSIIDFGVDPNSTPIIPPNFQPKLLNQVIKFKLRGQCCSKVLIIDTDPFSILSLEKVLQKFQIRSDYAFNSTQAFELIENKQKSPCHCKNKNYIIYYIDVSIQNINSIEFVTQMKKKIINGFIDKGFFISTGIIVDLNAKLDQFKSGIDYFIQKPFDLIEIIAAVQYLDF